MRMMTRSIFYGAIAAITLMGATSCDAPDVEEQAYTRVTQRVMNVDPARGEQRARGMIITAIDEAEEEVDLAISALDDPSVTDALVRAKARGVRVRVVMDEDETLRADGRYAHDERRGGQAPAGRYPGERGRWRAQVSS